MLKKWLEKELEKQTSLYKAQTQNYLHFDLKPSLKRAYLFLQNKNNVIKHAFYPLIRIDIKRRAFELQQDGKKIVVTKKPRPITYAAHLDGYIYSYYSFILQDLYEKVLLSQGLSKIVIAYRSITGEDGKRMNNVRFANEVFTFIASKKNCAVLTYDIKEFFESLDHLYLKKVWANLLNVETLPLDQYRLYKSLTNYHFIRRDSIYKALGLNNKRGANPHKLRLCNESEFRKLISDKSKPLIESNPQINILKGIPQGTPISGLLANIYLLEFDSSLNDSIKGFNYLYRRYSDDIIIVCPKSYAKKLHNLVMEEISKYKLEINLKKSKKFIFQRSPEGNLESFYKGNKQVIQYLGLEYNGQKSLIRSSSLSRYYRRMKYRVKGIIFSANRKFSIPRVSKRRLYQENTYLGKHNFINYALVASKIMKVPCGIKKQVEPHYKRLHREIKRWTSCKEN